MHQDRHEQELHGVNDVRVVQQTRPSSAQDGTHGACFETRVLSRVRLVRNVPLQLVLGGKIYPSRFAVVFQDSSVVRGGGGEDGEG